MVGPPFEAHIGRKLNTVWHTVKRSASVQKLTWKNVLFSLDRNQKMFPAKVMQDYRRVHANRIWVFDCIEHPLVSGKAVPETSKSELNKAPVLQAQKKNYENFSENQGSVEIETLF